MCRASSLLANVIAVLATLVAAAAARAEAGSQALAHLLASYPDHLDRVEGNTLVWRDGARMEIDDGKGAKAFEAWLADPDIEDMLAIPYRVGEPKTPPLKNIDPGRGRNRAFFDKMYGNCRTDEVRRNLTDVVWLPTKARQILKVTMVNGVDKKLSAVSQELDRLPAQFDAFLVPAASAYNCRLIHGTDRPSAHGHGIAIDIAVRQASYWRWSKPGADGGYLYENSIPMEIVRIFEKHGFIWGGKWYHFDTMHFEYRPELLP